MAKDTFSFKVGNLECLVITDSAGPMNVNALFPSLKAEEMDQLLEQNQVPRGDVMAVMCLLLRMDKRNVLLDTGWGKGKHEGMGKLVSILRTNGLTPEQIDTVIISHGHPDHIGGNTDEKGRPLFPKADYVMYKKEWDFWVSVPDLGKIEKWVQEEMHAFVAKNMTPLRERFTLVDEKTEFLPGIKFIRAPGHSPYHAVINIASGNEQLIYGSDLIHHPLQIARPDVCVFGDYDQEQSRRTRTGMISRIAEDKSLFFACHFPFPGLGRIEKRGDGLAWRPVKY
jgi:glyoxylase-like metal-dependent hydrolase (beta-lactamase superfamily II)